MYVFLGIIFLLLLAFIINIVLFVRVLYWLRRIERRNADTLFELHNMQQFLQKSMLEVDNLCDVD